MDFDKKHLILVGIAVLALFLMGLGLAFKRDIRKMFDQPVHQQFSTSKLTLLNQTPNQTP